MSHIISLYYNIVNSHLSIIGNVVGIIGTLLDHSLLGIFEHLRIAL